MPLTAFISSSNELDGNAQCFGADLQLLGLDRGTAVLPTYATSLNYHDTKVMLPTSNGWKTPFPTDLDLGAQLLAGSLFVQNAASELDRLVDLAIVSRAVWTLHHLTSHQQFGHHRPWVLLGYPRPIDKF